MNTASCKAKGRRLQQFVRDEVLKLHPELTERDVVSTSMGVSGDDLKLSEQASKLFPFSVECANQEALNIWAKLEQTIGQNRTLTPLLVFKRNHTDTYCALRFSDFLLLLKKIKELEDEIRARELVRQLGEKVTK